MTTKNITYLFGAGASYNAMPVLNELADAMLRWPYITDINELRKEKNPFDLCTTGHIEYEMYQLGMKSKEFNTIDTYAKMLLANGEDYKLHSLKKHLSYFLTIYQNIDSKLLKRQGEYKLLDYIDSRYISLIATFINPKKGTQLPENVNFITWNYDMQLELAFRKFFITQPTMHELDSYLSYIPSRDKIRTNYQVCHLNGISGFYINDNSVPRDFTERIKPNSEYSDIIRNLLKLEVDLKNYRWPYNEIISYSWDEDSISANALIRAKEIAAHTDALVIVGYSFPIFNREVDNVIFEEFKRKCSVIYYQDPNASADFLEETFELNQSISKSHPEIQIKIEKENMNQFVIPKI